MKSTGKPVKLSQPVADARERWQCAVCAGRGGYAELPLVTAKDMPDLADHEPKKRTGVKTGVKMRVYLGNRLRSRARARARAWRGCMHGKVCVRAWACGLLRRACLDLRNRSSRVRQLQVTDLAVYLRHTLAKPIDLFLHPLQLVLQLHAGSKTNPGWLRSGIDVPPHGCLAPIHRSWACA